MGTITTRRGTEVTEAGLRDVAKKIVKRVRNHELAERLIRKIKRYWETKNQRDDITLPESRIVYDRDDYGDKIPLSRKRDLNINWTDHAEYRSDLRDVDHDDVNEGVAEWLKNRLREKGPDSKKVRMKLPGTGTAVVDYDLTTRPADADVITVWGSEGMTASEALPTEEWLESLAKYVEKNGVEFVSPSQTVSTIRKMVKTIALYPEFTTDDVFQTLERRGVPEDEVELLEELPPPREKRVQKNESFDYVGFEQAIGKSIRTRGQIGDVGKEARTVIAAVSKLTGPAAKLWRSEVKKVEIVSSGREMARWDAGKVMVINLGKSRTVKDWVHTITHELGHALEEKRGLKVVPWDETPYGSPPYPSQYGSLNAAEDFAETFRMFVLEASLLKGGAPEKYREMKETI